MPPVFLLLLPYPRLQTIVTLLILTRPDSPAPRLSHGGPPNPHSSSFYRAANQAIDNGDPGSPVIPRPPDTAVRVPRRRPRSGGRDRRLGRRDRRLGRRAGWGAQPPPARTRPHYDPLWYGPLRAAVLERAEGEAYEGAQTGSPCPGPAKSTIDAIPNALGLESHLKSKDHPTPLVTTAMPAQVGRSFVHFYSYKLIDVCGTERKALRQRRTASHG